jgi:hypothetical protein
VRRTIAVAAAAAMGMAAAPALAKEVRFADCDGFAEPGRRYDGMTGQSNLFGGNMGEVTRAMPPLGAAGVEACTQLLADPRLLPQHRLRRASLLQARALHRLGAGEIATVLADVAAVDEAIGDDAYGRRSMGLSNRLLRAYVLYRTGDAAGAAAEAGAIHAERPYEPDIGLAAARLHLAVTRDWGAYRANLIALSPTNPSMIGALFMLAMTRGEFAEAIELYPQIAYPVLRGRDGFQVIALLQRRLRILGAQARERSAFAYALAAVGQHDRATAEIAAVRALVREAAAPPPPTQVPPTHVTPVPRTIPPDPQLVAFARAAARLEPVVDRAERLIRLRILAASGAAEAATALTEARIARFGTDGASLDLFRALARALPAEREQLAEPIRRMEQDIATALDRVNRFDLDEVLQQFPEPETIERTPAFSGGSGLVEALLGDGDGYRTYRSNVTGARTIGFASRRGSPGAAGELVLLRAAQLAREGGHRGLIVLRRQVALRIRVTTMYGQPIGQSEAGQQAEIDVLFVDPDNLPPAYAGARGRVLDPNDIWTRLSPVFVRAPAPRAR